MLLFLICQGRWGLMSCAILFAERGGITYQILGIFPLASVFYYFYHTQKSMVRSLINNAISTPHPHPKSNMSLPVFTTIKEIKEANRRKTKIGVGSIVTEKVGDMGRKTKEGRSRMVSKEVVECVQYLMGENKFLVQFEDGQNIYMGYFLLGQVCSEEEVVHEVNSPIYDLPPQSELLTIDGNPVDEVECMFEKVIYFSVIYI